MKETKVKRIEYEVSFKELEELLKIKNIKCVHDNLLSSGDYITIITEE